MLMRRQPGAAGPDPYHMPTPNHVVSDDVARKLAAVHRAPMAELRPHLNNAAGKSSDKVLAWLQEGYEAWRPLNLPSPAFETAFAWLRQRAEIVDRAPRGVVQ